MKRVGAMAFILSGFVKDIVIMCTASHPLEAIQCVGGNSHWAILTYARFMVPIFIGSLSVFSVRFGRRDDRARNDMVAYLIGNSFCAVLLNITIAKL